MTIKITDHVRVVDDLAPAIAFFTTLGMALEGEMSVLLSRLPAPRLCLAH